jgi:hypothetical protein
MMDSGKIDPTAMITHIGGLDCVVDTTLNLPNIPGGKKLVYNHIRMPLTAISDFAELGKQDEMFAELANICDRHNGLWNGEAEKWQHIKNVTLQVKLNLKKLMITHMNGE